MACPIPIRIINPHYKKIASHSATELDSYSDREDFYIDVPCGRCYHCRKSYKTSWNLRLQHEWRYMTSEQKNNSFFVTLTFTDDVLPAATPTKEQIAPLIRRFLERVRKHYKVSVRHWIVSEYGDTTQRFHLHGLLFNVPFPIWKLAQLWRYGYVSYRRLSPRRITYVTTYVNKQLRGLLEDPKKRQYVFSSPGLGKAYTEDRVTLLYSHHNGVPVPFIYHNNRPFAMPRYYRGKLFTEDEREDMTQSYFHFRSEDVIPPPPYYLGVRKFTDYTLYLEACQELRGLYNQLFKPKSYGKKFEQPQSDFEIA